MQDDVLIPDALLTQSRAQRAAIETHDDLYVQIAAHQLRATEPDKLRMMYCKHRASLDLSKDPIVALAERIVRPVREAKRVLAQQGGHIDRSIRQLQHLIEFLEAGDPMIEIANDAIAHLRTPEGLRAVFAAPDTAGAS